MRAKPAEAQELARGRTAVSQTWLAAELDSTAAATVKCAVELPFIESAPCMYHTFDGGVKKEVHGVPLAFLCLDRAFVLDASAKLRRL